MTTSPLDAAHRSLGARMVPFGGWEMPLSYPDGTLAEHRRCREDAVVFDVSHLGTVSVAGPGATEALQRSFTNDLQKVGPGRAQYTHLLAEDGSVLDDIIVWWLAEDRFEVMPNASNTERVVGALRQAAEGIEVSDTTRSRAVLAVQGPRARERVRDVVPAAADVGRFRVLETELRGHRMVVAGTGYTGEDGIECAVDSAGADLLWDAVLGAGIAPAGLGARDTLRLEAGLPLHGQELGPGITPLNAGLGWVVAWDKGDFPGRDALVAQRDAGVDPVLCGLRVQGRRPPRTGQEVVRDGTVVGQVSSGNFSPVLGCGIAMAYLPAATTVGDHLVVRGRGGDEAAEVVALPFVGRS